MVVSLKLAPAPEAPFGAEAVPGDWLMVLVTVCALLLMPIPEEVLVVSPAEELEAGKPGWPWIVENRVWTTISDTVVVATVRMSFVEETEGDTTSDTPPFALVAASVELSGVKNRLETIEDWPPDTPMAGVA